MTLEAGPKRAEMETPWISSSEICGQGLEKIEQGLKANPELKERLIEDRFDPSPIIEFEIDGIPHTLNNWHQDSQANMNERTTRTTLTSISDERRNIVNITTTYHKDENGNRVYQGSGRLELRMGDKTLYRQEAIDNLELAFPKLFPNKS